MGDEKIPVRGQVFGPGIRAGFLFFILFGGDLQAFPAMSSVNEDSLSISDSSSRSIRNKRAIRVREPYPGARLLLSVPLADLPFGSSHKFSSPSMQQSLRWNAAVTQLANQSLG
jgi:hypothetical protein